MIRTTSIILGLSLLFCLNIKAQLSINEILASNSTVLADNAGEFDDWIEIYNAGGQDINLAGYYISDDLTDPIKWQIPLDDPSLTTVSAGGFLILWADNDPDQGPHHIDFKLSGAGEDLVLIHSDGVTVLDQISFSNQAQDISYGRVTDGGTDFQLFSSPTPGATNNGGGGGLTFPVELCTQIMSDDEDGEESQNGAMDLQDGIHIGENFNGPNMVALRFQVALPQGAIVTNATINFTALGSNETEPADWNFHAHLIADAPALNTTNFNISQRPLTTASINWVPSEWHIGGGSGLAEETSPNLATVLQEVIDLNGWQEGNSVVFIITGSGERNAFSGSNPNLAPKLCIEAGIPYPSDPISNVFINEIAAAGTPYVDEQDDREDWIELYNANNFEVDLSGLYLTDNYGDLDLHKIPDGVTISANGFLTFFADSDEEDGVLHTNFNLRSKGEEVALAMQLSTGLVILDSISFDDAPFMSSYGRQTDGASEWILFGAPTPDASNNGADLYLIPPTFTLPSGVYDNIQEVTEITHPEQDVTIYYTTDASLPDNSDFLYSAPITISGTRNIRAIAYKNGYAPSQIANAAYLTEIESNIPIIYLTTELENFFDPEIGIYVTGTNGIPLCGLQDTANYNRDWERPINFKMFLPDGSEVVDVNAGVKISGVCSRQNAMKSLAISLREKDYGNGELGYRLFDNRDHNNYLRFKLRNSGQDYNRMGFRDMANQAMLKGVVKDLEYQNGQAARVYLNGQFWGIHNIREKYTGEFFADNFGANAKKIDILKSPGLPWVEVKQGSTTEFNTLFDFVQNNSLVDENNYQYFEENVDINAFLNYWIAMTYLANTDWPANNLTVWKEQKEGKKWRYCVADTDGSTKNFLSELSLPEYNTLDSIMVPDSEVWPNHSSSTLFLRRLVEREDFQNEFVQRACSFIGLVYSEQRAHHFADSIKALYDPNIEDHLTKWGGAGALGATGLDMATDIDIWESWVAAYKEFFTDRPDYFRQYMDSYFNLNSTYNLTFVFDETTLGRVVVNTSEMEMPYNFSNLYFKDVPLRVKAIAKPGATFSHWLETGVTDTEIDFVGTENTTLTPVFVCADLPGTVCDDGDDCTENDIVTEDCECKGTIPDNNGDGEMNELDCIVDTEEVNLPKPELKFFPNPVSNTLTIQLDNLMMKTLEVYNSSGIPIFHKKDINGNRFILSAKTLFQGIYFIRMQGIDGNFYYGNFSVIR